ncbi:MAG: mannose-6-phosphate isomerase, class I [Deltaproteobacteria bacterium]|nr:mannose-6-phosphate isomerase, class I [Deltaproteobacteria bacterium]
MKSIEILENVIQEYSWGSYTEIPEILGQKCPSSNPQAELWMGAHPIASSMLTVNGKKESLYELVKKYPDEILGKSVSKRFGVSFPFLFKVLAAEKPLSIQVHPNLKQAKEGYEKENKERIALNSEKRNYKDKNHKPECICALTDFWVLNGFRKISDIVSFMERLSGGIIENEISQLKKSEDTKGLKCFFKALMTTGSKKKENLINTVVLNAEKNDTADPSYRWITELHKEYGNDIGVLSPLLLNLVCLKPGEAMFLSSGELHAYLKGACIELMTNSDNVIRGGLTIKHVDILELLRIVKFEEKSIKLLAPEQAGKMEIFYPCAATEFLLSRIHVQQNDNFTSSQKRSVEIMMCVDGNAAIQDIDSGKTINLEKGTSVLIPAVVNMYQLKGEAILYKAGVPL